MKILLVQTGFLGDTVLSSPVVGALRRLYPEGEIWVLTTPLASDFFRRDPDVTGVLAFHKRGKARGLKGLRRFARELKHMQFEVVYSTHKSARTALLLWLARIPKRVGFTDGALSSLYTERIRRPTAVHEVARALSIVSNDFTFEMRQEFERVCAGVVNEELGQLRLFLPKGEELSDSVRQLTNGTRQYIVLVPGSAWETKRWKWQGFCDIARNLVREGYEVVLVGSRDEREIAEKIADHVAVTNLVGETSVSDVVAVIDCAAAVVCNDSVALHIAAARKTPTVAVFCATTPRFGFGPWQTRAAVVEVHDLFCKPCGRHGSRKCPQGTNACMENVESREVLAQLHSQLKPSSGLKIVESLCG